MKINRESGVQNSRPAARQGGARGCLACAGEGSASRGSAFTLLEVVIASAIFFMVAFAILGLVTHGLAAARSLQQRIPDAGILAASLSMTNQLEEGGASGDFEDLYPGLYPGYTWEREVMEVGSNGLFQVDFRIHDGSPRKRGASDSGMSILMFRPGSKPGSASKGRP